LDRIKKADDEVAVERKIVSANYNRHASDIDRKPVSSAELTVPPATDHDKAERKKAEEAIKLIVSGQRHSNNAASFDPFGGQQSIKCLVCGRTVIVRL
jgi:hypothetical protein